MAASSRFRIVGVGGTTPIGRTMSASAAAARAGVSGFAEHPFMIDTAGEPMRVAAVSWLPTELGGVERYCALLFPAIDECLRLSRGDGVELPAGLALGLPPCRPGRPPALAEQLIERIAVRYRGMFSVVEAFECGHAAGYVGAQTAIAALGSGRLHPWVIAAVDSYIAPETLEWLEASDQLHGAGSFNNAWGFIPGEAAGAVMIAPAAAQGDERAGPYCELVSVGVARETNSINTAGVCVGQGLTRAFRDALGGIGSDERVDNVVCDLNGETYRADEYGFAVLRTREHFRAPTNFVAPADCWGDVGAASAPLHLSLVLISHARGYAGGSLSMTWGSSESGERGAAVVRGVTNRRV